MVSDYIISTPNDVFYLINFITATFDYNLYYTLTMAFI